MRETGVGRRDVFPRPMAAVVVGLAAGTFLLLAANGSIVSLAILAVMLVFLVTLSIPVLKRVLLALALLEIPIQLDIYLNHEVAISESSTVSGFNISVTTIVLVALYSLWGAEVAAGITRRNLDLKAGLPSLVYLALVVISIVVAGDVLLALYEIVILAQAILLFLYLLHHFRTRRDVMFVLMVLIAGLILQGVGGLAVGIADADMPLWRTTKVDIDDGRVLGTFKSPNNLGAYLTLLLPVALGLALSSADRLYRRLGGLAFALGSVVLVMSFSRGAWFGFAVSIGWMLVVAWRRKWLVGLAPVAVVAAALLFFVMFQDEILLRVGEYNNQAARSRLPLMDLAFEMIRDAPLFGVGANNFAASLDPYVTVEFSRDWIATVHNKYLLVWAETGILALLAFLWVLVSAIRTGWRGSTTGDRLLAPIALGLAAGIVANMIHMTVDRFHFRPQIQMLWVVIALILVIPRAGRVSNSTPAGLEQDAFPASAGTHSSVRAAE